MRLDNVDRGNDSGGVSIVDAWEKLICVEMGNCIRMGALGQ
jgi:hypothetical protein